MKESTKSKIVGVSIGVTVLFAVMILLSEEEEFRPLGTKSGHYDVAPPMSPVFHPAFNMRMIIMELVLLEDHFNLVSARCFDCITAKHLLKIEAYAEEAISLQDNDTRVLPSAIDLNEIVRMARDWQRRAIKLRGDLPAEDMGPNNHRVLKDEEYLQLGKEARKLRKSLVKYKLHDVDWVEKYKTDPESSLNLGVSKFL